MYRYRTSNIMLKTLLHVSLKYLKVNKTVVNINLFSATDADFLALRMDIYISLGYQIIYAIAI